MGGRGSGQWYRWDARDVADSCRSIDIRRWGREGMLRPGNWFGWYWRTTEGETTASINVSVGGTGTTAERVTLDYRSRRGNGPWEDVRYEIGLTSTPCHYGGRRAWFVCPGVVNGRMCGRRVAVLYNGGRYFLCRHCHGLAYRSQRDDPLNRARSRATAIARRLDPAWRPLDGFPARPKGMHWRTYRRLLVRWAEAEEATTGALRALLGRMGAWGED